MNPRFTRRDFVKGTLLSSAALASSLDGHGAAPTAAQPPAPGPTGASLPRGRIGSLEVSRLILGGNLLTHYTHSRDLQYVYKLAAHYNTDEKILDTLTCAEKHGINTLSIHNPPHAISLLKRHRRERAGTIQWIVCPTAPVEPGLAKYRREVEDLVKDGANAIYLWGVHGDALVNAGQLDLVVGAVQAAKALGVPSGVGAHSLDVVKACEERGVDADFYIKTFHHHKYPTGPKPEELGAPYSEYPGYWCRNPEETAELMKGVTKPWIAFKTMAAGAIPPKEAFPYVFANGADFLLAGMFDFEIAEDTQIAIDALAACRERARPWRG